MRQAARVLGAAAGVLLASSPGRADVRDDARRVAELWARAGQQVQRPAALFLEQGRTRRLKLDEPGYGCLSVAVLSPRSVEFALRPEAPAGVPAALVPAERSGAGLAFASDCGDGRERLARLVVEMRSARGAIEVLAGVSVEPAPDPREALPERVVMPTRPQLDPGRAPGGDPLKARAARAEGRARADGAAEVQIEELAASDEGQGRFLRPFREGCHRVEILAEVGAGGRVFDVDAELRDARTDALVARDRSDTPDARLEFCTGEPSAAALLFRGAPARAPIRLLSARWPHPASLPTQWGGRARSAMAFALSRRRAGAPRAAPAAMATGVAGTTLLPLELVPGSCYLVALGLARGEVRGLSISGVLEGQLLHDEGGQGRDGLALAFCSQHTDRLALRVEARGAQIVWGAALWRMGRAP